MCVKLRKCGDADLLHVSMLSRGGAEEAAGRNECGLTAARAGEGAEQEDGPGAEDERGGQVQVRHFSNCRSR